MPGQPRPQPLPPGVPAAAARCPPGLGVGGECGEGSSAGALDVKTDFFFFLLFFLSFFLSPLVGEGATPAGGWLSVVLSGGCGAG